ncbi:biogenesis of lysosome-related organelles complex 1 subunit 5 [Anthonomus grandis grandis]|uniref:biogenesis of lysosome-related organelles complex 1 subunit 5 n=1 Tax=Anthonomus grandis grandis TaxID=2921223 RepID=UPI002166AE28|nr:biogenesis of lysosome-related organelles complex 1 subunit 5 [Anthonomus grandis grandis]XP_050313828.1 biogenesis of lysosome-related organelles complex 1 subunit 5 [Anthonomus grandis grandis]
MPATDEIARIWDRLFEQKCFLSREIDFLLKEFESKRKDIEVDSIFKTIENITDIKNTQINNLNEIVNEKAIDSNQKLSESLNICNQFMELENIYAENAFLEETRSKRKLQWEKIMDKITSEYSQINIEFEEKERLAKEHHKNLELKLK